MFQAAKSACHIPFVSLAAQAQLSGQDNPIP